MIAEPARRTVDWYELFFDVVVAAVVAVAAGLIEVDTSLNTVAVFVLVLFPIWWAWVDLMVTNNLFGRRVPIAGGTSEFSWLYATGAAWIRLTLLAMWLMSALEGSKLVVDGAHRVIQPRDCGNLAGIYHSSRTGQLYSRGNCRPG